MDEIERTSFAGENVSAVQFAECERTKSKRVAHTDDFAFAHDHERESALEATQRAERTPAVLERLRKQMRNQLAICCRLENGAVAFQLVAKHTSVDQVSIVGDSDLASVAIDHKWLRIFQRARSRGRVARVPDGAGSLQSLQLFLSKDLRDQPHVPMQLEVAARPVAGDDAGAFLAAMLQREQTVIGQDRCVRMTEYTENSAFVLRQSSPIG